MLMLRLCATSREYPSRRTIGGVTDIGGLEAVHVKRRKEHEKPNARTKRLLAEAALDRAALKELAARNLWTRRDGAPSLLI